MNRSIATQHKPVNLCLCPTPLAVSGSCRVTLLCSITAAVLNVIIQAAESLEYCVRPRPHCTTSEL